MSNRLAMFLAASMFALPLPCFSQALDQVDVVMSPLEAVREADPDFARSLSQQLMAAIERNSQFRVALDGPARYRLKGVVSAEGQRHFVALTLLESNTNKMLWFENYDYRGITADMMAADLIAALSDATSSRAQK